MYATYISLVMYRFCPLFSYLFVYVYFYCMLYIEEVDVICDM